MIEGGWAYITPAYAITLSVLALLALVVIVRLRTWAKRAGALERKP